MTITRMQSTFQHIDENMMRKPKIKKWHICGRFRKCDSARERLAELSANAFPLGNILAEPSANAFPLGNILAEPSANAFPLGNILAEPSASTFPLGNRLAETSASMTKNEKTLER